MKQLWDSDDALSNHYATSVYHDGYVYGYHGRQEFGQSLRAIELKTGKVQWNFDRFGAGTVTLAGDELLLIRESGELIVALATPRSSGRFHEPNYCPPRCDPIQPSPMENCTYGMSERWLLLISGSSFP